MAASRNGLRPWFVFTLLGLWGLIFPAVAAASPPQLTSAEYHLRLPSALADQASQFGCDGGVLAANGLVATSCSSAVCFTYDAPIAIPSGGIGEAAGSLGQALALKGGVAQPADSAGYIYDSSVDFVAPNSTRIFRAVEPDELADLRNVGQYRAGGPNAEWLDGKRFWLSQADADGYVALATKADLGGPYCVTSGCIPNSVLDQIQVVPMDGMDAVFLPNDLLPHIDNLNLPSTP